MTKFFLVLLGCFAVPQEDVRKTPMGYYVESVDVFFAFSSIVASGDGRFWVCTSDGRNFALYVPEGEKSDVEAE